LLSCIEYSRSNGNKLQEDGDAGKLKIYSEDIEKQLWEEAKDISNLGDDALPEEQRRLKTIKSLLNQYPSQLQFPTNAVLIGTLNSDETTYDLSPKMIDRSYVITFPPADFESSPSSETHAIEPVSVSELVKHIGKAIDIPSEHWKTILSWNQELQSFGIPLGYRVKRDYDVFRATGSILGLSEQECLGYFLFCKILPRIFFFKEQSSNTSITSETRCKKWLEKLKEEFSDFGPVRVIDTMIRMCEDERISTVRYWSKS
jgi:hypothetical protein